MSYQLGSLFGKDNDKTDQTASIGTTTPATTTPAPVSEPAPATASIPAVTPTAYNVTVEMPPEIDLVYAKAAAAEVLGRDTKDASAQWENPRTGARGTVTPIAAAYTIDGFVCRDFLASYVRAGSESWMQGEACRIHQGRWEVRNLRPWKRT